MRIKNFSDLVVRVPTQRWTHPEHGGHIEVATLIAPGEVTDELDPEDPILQIVLRGHPELKPFLCPTFWERIRSL